jgi:hypothetical protein
MYEQRGDMQKTSTPAAAYRLEKKQKCFI